MVAPASYYLLHGNFHQPKPSKKGKGALELTQPAASQRLSSMMKQTFKANSHGLPTPSTGGGGQGFRQSPVRGGIKVPKQLIAQMHKSTAPNSP